MKKSKTVFFCMNRNTRCAERLTGEIFQHWEMVQAAFAVGIMMADGNTANGIGRCTSIDDFERKAAHSGITVLNPHERPNAREAA